MNPRQWPAVFNWLQTAGNVSQHEMYRTFNCGVGMVIALPEAEVDNALALLNEKVKTRGESVSSKRPIPNSVWSLNENIVVLISGNGSNLQAIIDACKQKKSRAPYVQYSVIRPTRSALNVHAKQAFRLIRWRQASLPAVKPLIAS